MTNLTESRGFPNREFGDVYHNPSKPEDLMTFQDFKAYPDAGNAWPNAQQAAKEWNKIQHYISQVGQVKELNKPNAGLLAVMVVHMLDPKTKQHWFFAKWTKDKTNVAGKFTSIPAGAVGDEHPGLIYKKGASEQYRLKPVDIMSTAGPYTAKDIANQIDTADLKSTAPLELVQQLQFAVQSMAARKPWPITIENGAQYMSFHSKYTNEWLAPLALSGGMIPGPDRKMLEANLTGGKSLVNSTISYSATATEALTDSSITTKEGYTIGISSKQQGGGAAASLKGVHDIMEKKKDQFGSAFFKQPKVSRFKKIIDIIMNNGQLDGMLLVALYLGIIVEEDTIYIKEGKLNKVTAKNLMKKFNARTDNPNYSPKFHLVAAIAQEVCNRLNAEDYTDVFKAVINKASLVQMYLRTKIRNKTDLDLLGMDVVWPPVIEGRIMFTAAKNFTSSEVRGKLGFKIV